MAAVITAVSALVAICCGTRDRTHPPVAPTAGAASGPSAPVAGASGGARVEPADSAATSGPSAEIAPAAAMAPEDRTKLPGFYAALRALERKTRTKHVRVLWYGDSHAAADFWSGTLRTGLQKRFGDGGVGFVYLGYKEYRHDGLKIGVDGKWGMRPKKPATSVPSGDRVFGLGGIMLHGFADGPRATLTVADPRLGPKLEVDVCYRLDKPGDELSVTLGGGAPNVVHATAGLPAGKIHHLELTSDVSGPTLQITPTAGRPELCGVVIEADPSASPGVIVDTLGINGAKFATLLAWDEPAWAAELARRDPDLVIFEYGTNEATDEHVKPTVFGGQLTQAVARLRRVKPDADCLVIGPTERADRQDFIPLVRDALRLAAHGAGCGFWDTYAAMGGRGAVLAWQNETPPRAARDGIHLTPKGYKELGERLVADLMRGYSPQDPAIARTSDR